MPMNVMPACERVWKRTKDEDLLRSSSAHVQEMMMGMPAFAMLSDRVALM